MYESFYGLSGRPFQLTPDPQFYFGSSTHKDVKDRIVAGLEDNHALTVITGDVGTGKTTLIRHLVTTLDEAAYVCAVISNTQLKAEQFLGSVLAAFDQPVQETSEDTLRAQLDQFVRVKTQAGIKPILVVDEAQNLANDVLNKLKIILAIKDDEQSLIRCFLTGQPEIIERISNENELEELRGYMAAHCEIAAMKAEEIGDYLIYRLEQAGWDGNPSFTVEALEALYKHSVGIPRKLNTLCARILLYGALEELNTLDDDAVNSVAADMANDASFKPTRLSSARPMPQQGGTSGVNLQNDTTIPLEAAQQVSSNTNKLEQLDGRIDELEDLMKSRNESVEQLAALMTQIVGKS